MQKESYQHGNKDERRLLYKNIPLTLFVTFACERELETEQRLQYIDPHSYGHQRCVFLVLLMLNRRPGGSLCWLSLLHLITNWSGPQTPSGVPRAPLARCGFPYHISSLTRLISNSPDFLSSPNYIIVQSPTQSPTQSLEWHV